MEKETDFVVTARDLLTTDVRPCSIGRSGGSRATIEGRAYVFEGARNDFIALLTDIGVVLFELDETVRFTRDD